MFPITGEAMNGIAVANLWFAFKNRNPVLKGVSFEVRPGEIVGLAGPNGSGKTTTLRIIAGLLNPDEGAVHVAGAAAGGDGTARRRITAFIPDHSLLYDALSGEENMNMFGLLWGLAPGEIRSRSDALFAEVGLSESRRHYVSQYSAGMRQKLSFCCALLNRPSVVIMDEPFTAMDLHASAWSQRMLRDRAAAGAAVLFSSHDRRLIDGLATRVLTIEDGRIT
ncbi:MAG: ABC transporter ATP-binding protein [Vicinamibacterales bacterium]